MAVVRFLLNAHLRRKPPYVVLTTRCRPIKCLHTRLLNVPFLVSLRTEKYIPLLYLFKAGGTTRTVEKSRILKPIETRNMIFDGTTIK